MDMGFGMWNIRRLYREGSLMTVLKELSKYTLDLMGIQDVRRPEVAQNQQAKIYFSKERGIIIMK
jgi:hypothetical protein